MPIRQQADEKPFYEVTLADDRLGDLRFDAVDRRVHGRDLGLEVFKFGSH